MSFPETRPRRLRRTEALRRMVRETTLSVDNLMYPLFICPGKGVRKEIPSLPGQFHLSIDELDREAEDESLAKTERDRLDRLRPEASIDLHGMTEDAALDSLGTFLEDSRRRGYRKVLIIHGKGNHSGGDPVLKRAVRHFLERYPGAGRSGSADKTAGGNGATWLILKR